MTHSRIAMSPCSYGAVANALGVIIALSLAGCGGPGKEEKTNAENPNCATDNENCHAKGCCKNAGKKCFVKDTTWASCRAECVPGSVNANDPKKYRTPWTCEIATPPAAAPAASAAASVGPQPVPAPMPVMPVASVPAPAPIPAGPAAAPPQCSSGITKGGLTIQGMPGFSYLAGSGGTLGGSTLTINHDSGFSVMDQCNKDWVPTAFTEFHLVGRHITFTVDLSKVGCACNLAFYLISAAAKDESGAFAPGDECATSSPYYCDANQVCGQWCPEVDIMEANNHVFQSTVHKCDPPNANGHYSNCDRGGCAGGQNTKNMGANSYGLGAQYTIDTSKSFVVDTFFPETGGTLSGMLTVLWQETRELTLDHTNCDPGYFTQLSAAMLEGMSLRLTYWGSDAQTMNWMDQPPCGPQSCDGTNAGAATISDISVTGHQPTTPPPLPSIGPPHATEPPPEPTPQPSSGGTWMTYFFWFFLVVAVLAAAGWYYMQKAKAREIQIAAQREAELLRQEQENEIAERAQKTGLSIFNCSGWPCATKKGGYTQANANAPKRAWATA